jgi:geranylgeranyl pyrophosphate synthase
VDALGLLDVPRLEDRLSAVGDGLRNACQADDPVLEAANRRVIQAGGKRLRPALTIATAWLADYFDARVVAAGVAVELVQVGSLVHDDLLDDAATRRGIPTINAVEGNTDALLAGTLLLARAGGQAALAGQRVAVDVARAVGTLCVGQTTESEHLFDLDQRIPIYLATIEAKTASLFACACRVGAVVAELPETDVESLGEFGRNFGIAFQLIDDVLDLIGNAEKLGKPIGSDLRAGVLTLPVLLALQDAQADDLRAFLERRRPIDLEQATRIVIAAGRVDETITLARRYAAAASQAVARISGSGALALQNFAPNYLDWALERFVDNSLGHSDTN